MPDYAGLPETWRALPIEENGEYSVVMSRENDDAAESYRELIEWVKESPWAGIKVYEWDYALGGPQRDWEYKYPYHLGLTMDANEAMDLRKINLDDPAYGGNNVEEGVSVCGGCFAWGIPLEFTSRRGENHRRWWCDTCNPKCTECGDVRDLGAKLYTGGYNRVTGGMNHIRGNKLCSKCRPVAECFACGMQMIADSPHITQIAIDGDVRTVCERCKMTNICRVCHEWGPVRKNGQTCNACFVKQFDKVINQEPKFAIGTLPKEGLLFPDLPQRPFRTISIETEMDGDKDALSAVLYSCGIIAAPRVENYHSYPDHSAEWMCHLKHDGTATAGELISHLLNLNDKDHADGLVNMLRRLHGLEKLGLINYGSGCGGHIHIDAHNYDWNDVYRLITIFGYVEDVIYRLAGAGSSYGHRSLDKGARTANGVAVGSYSRPVRKGPFGSLENFIMTMKGEQERGLAINLLPYTQAIGNCRCNGGKHGKLKFCTCNLGKATIEWRIWNATGNPRILHAWIAIMQAMHAYCEGDGPPAEEWLAQYPAFAYTGKKWINNPTSHADTAKQRMEWMFREFVFTPDERKSILYAIEASEMAGMFNLKERNMYLRQGVPELPPKNKPRNPVRRERNIVITPRTPDEIRRVKESPLVRGR